MLLIPAWTVLAVIASARLFALRSKVGEHIRSSDTAFLVLGIVVSGAGVATCFRMAVGLMFERYPHAAV
jgi:hypothetical protein